MDPAVAGIPADRRGDVAVAELRERSTFGRVGVADVVAERPKLLGVAFGKCGEDATGADGAELAVVAHDDQLCSGSLHGGEEPGEVDIGGWRPYRGSARAGPRSPGCCGSVAR